MKNNYNIVLFGVGYWGKNHLRELDNCEEVSQIFVVDPVAQNDHDLLSSYKEGSFYQFSLKQSILCNFWIFLFM